MKAVNDAAERAVKLMQNFHGKIMAKEQQKQYLSCCVQEHRKLYPHCRKETLKENIHINFFFFFIIYLSGVNCCFLFHCINKNIIVW